jgi:hypothetical protein
VAVVEECVHSVHDALFQPSENSRRFIHGERFARTKLLLSCIIHKNDIKLFFIDLKPTSFNTHLPKEFVVITSVTQKTQLY